jgi:hypothetical protein
MFWNLAHDFVLGVLASITATLVGPYDMIGFSVAAIFACIGIVRWHRVRLKEGKRGMDSWYFIALSFLVAALAIGAATYGIGLRSASVAIANSPPQPKKYFPADIDARIKAIDRLDTIIAAFHPLLEQSQEFWNHINEMIGNGTASAALTKYANDANPLFAELDLALSEYRIRFPELDGAVRNTEYSFAVGIYANSLNLRGEIAKWAGQPNAIQTILNTRTYAEWDRTIHGVQPWMEKSRQTLAQIRQQYAAAEVYSDRQK